jgi:hypothetical protein
MSPTTIGDESPLGTGFFHFTFLSGPTSTGGFWSSATPDPPGPRNCGHGASDFELEEVAAKTTVAAKQQSQFVMFASP